jgi:16S rRNA (adenine1518-N6/adenine1519-N6)-dimethyltransferase
MLLHVDQDAFTPPPEVESALVRLRPRDTVPAVDEDVFFQVVKTVFTHRRKKLRNALPDSAHILNVDRETLKNLDLPHAHTRVVNLSVDDLVDVYETVKPVV